MTKRLDQSIEAAGRGPIAGGSSHDGSGNPRPPRRRPPIVRMLVLVVALGAIALSAASAQAATFVHPVSQKVALIPGNGPAGGIPVNGPDGIMPISLNVTGYPAESFNQFSFKPVGLSQIPTANLSQYDTVVLIQVPTGSLTLQDKTVLAQFVANGGKLIIHDSDETRNNDYSWLFPGSPFMTKIGAGCAGLAGAGCGSRSGTSTITPNSHTLISGQSTDSAYVNLADMDMFTDAIGDANLLVTSATDPHWFSLATGANANHEKGAQVAYAASNNGLIVYNGFDTDYIKARSTDPFRSICDAFFPCTGIPTVDWLAHMWYHELLQGWGTPGGGGGVGGGTGGGAVGLPHTTPLGGVGTSLAANLAGLPSNHRCVPRRTLSLLLKKLSHLPHQKVVRVDVLINGNEVRHEKGHFRNVTVKHLPRHGTYTVEVIVTTKRGYHLIAKRRYHGC